MKGILQLLAVIAVCTATAVNNIHDSVVNDSVREKRGAPITDPRMLQWDTNTPISYTFSADFSDIGRKKAREAMDAISVATCLSFVENRSGSPKILFKHTNVDYSFTSYGRPTPNEGNTREIAIHPSDEKQSIAHELLHALGIAHTMTRRDREKYIRIEMGNVRSDGKIQFAMLKEESSNNDFGVPFDFGSIMMYNVGIFTKDGSQVMFPHDPDYTCTMGSRYFIPFNDHKLINGLYRCSKKCNSSIQCENGGYQNSHDCQSCICPQYFTGTRCEKTKQEIILPEKKSITVIYERANYSSDYKTKDWDEFSIDGPRIYRAPVGKRIKVKINKILPYNLSGKGVMYGCECPCGQMGIELNDGTDMSVSGKLFCCHDEIAGKSFITKSNVLGYKSYAANGMPYTSEIVVSIVD